jgi:hypothetical protein
MSAAQHIEWLGLIEKRGPFLAVGVLEDAFPQDLEAVDTLRRQRVRAAYEEWSEAIESEDPQADELHREWIKLILAELLEYQPEVLKRGEDLPVELTYTEPTTGSVIRPDYALCGSDKTHLLISCYPPGTDLEAPLAKDTWAASPIERMTALCRSTQVRVGMVTNGELWSLVSAPADGSTSIGTWHARLWQQEPITLRAFVSLPGVRRFFGQPETTPEALFAKSLENQEGVTETLGEQVRRAVEVLVQALDRADIDRDRALLKDVSTSKLYEAGLTVMMRLVVLLCAEERKLLLLGDPIYDQNYAVSTLRSQLLEEKQLQGEEVLERRFDAWSRLLAVFRAVYGGIEHEELRLPPLGGSLFNPDRFPFLEGRLPGTTWKDSSAEPLPIDNRTVLLMLDALLVLEQKAGAQLLSYEALDVEQIGHVYEGLLERSVKRVPGITLGLIGSKKAVNPVIALAEIERLAKEGSDRLVESLNELTLRSEAALKNALKKQVDEESYRRLLLSCGNNVHLADRIKPFALLLRTDSWGEPIVYPENSFIVALGNDRRDTGSHYTPRSLTEPIVQHTLEPLVYLGPAEGKPQNEWVLKSPAEILDLKVCDMAMGSAAFLVQAARYLGEKLIEAWSAAEDNGKRVTVDGLVVDDLGDAEPLPEDKAEQIVIARRLVVGRCLYGVDINPMAVELAKVSLWLVTMMRNRPFGFLDHALKCGDALLGVSSVEQIENFSLRPGERQVTFASANLFRYVDEASAKRRALEDLPSNDHTQIETKNRLHAEAEAATAKVKAVADCLIAFELRGLNGDAYEDQRTEEAEKVQLLMKHDADASLKSPISNLQSAVATYARDQLRGRRPFHWAVEFPEVFARGGFDALVGNPPFLGGKKISGNFGDDYRSFIAEYLGKSRKGVADLSVYFLLRALNLASDSADVGLVLSSSIAEGESKRVGLDHLAEFGAEVINAEKNRVWPGSASVTYSALILAKPSWQGGRWLDGLEVPSISASLTPTISESGKAHRLAANRNLAFIGSYILGTGFTIPPEEARDWCAKHPHYKEVLFPFLSGGEMNDHPTYEAPRWVINFFDWPLDRTSAPAGYTGRVAADFPELLEIVRREVKPLRDQCKRKVYRERWWQFGEKGVDLYKAIKGRHSVLAVAASATKHVEFAVLPPNIIYALTLAVIPRDSFSVFALLSSGVHKEWVREHASHNLSLSRYTPSDCLQTFPFPNRIGALEEIGTTFHDLRRQIMQTRQEGLTKTYNRFHDRGEQSADIARLRALHVEMDQAVAAAYGWSDLDLGHGFRATKQGERYTISEPARRTVLDRLLALNHQRYEEEVKAGLHDKKKKPATKRKSKAEVPAQGTLL